MKNETDNITPKRTAWRPRRSCWIVAALILVPAWVLVAIPGVESDEFSTRNLTYKETLHGWPLMHYRRGCLWDSRNPSSTITSIQQDARVYLETFQPIFSDPVERQAPIFNLRFSAADDWYYDAKTRRPFWSAMENWPMLSSADGLAGEFHPWLFVGNLACLALMFICFAAVLEWQVKIRGSWFRVSVKETLCMVTAICICAYVLTAKIDRARNENALVQKVEDFMAGATGSEIYENRENYFPQIIANLFDCQKMLPPPLAHIFTPINGLSVEFLGAEPQEFNQLIRLVNETSVPIILVSSNDAASQKLLRHLDSNRIVELTFSYYSFYNDDDSMKLPYTNELPSCFGKLKDVVVHLEEDPEQANQMAPFLVASRFPTLESITFTGVNESGADFLLKTAHSCNVKPDVKLSFDLANSKIGELEEAGIEYESEDERPPMTGGAF